MIGTGHIPGTTTKSFTEAAINCSSTGNNILVAAVANQTIRVFRLFFVVSAATDITIKDGTGTSLTGAMTLSASGAFVLDFQSEAWFQTTAGNGFIISQSGTAQISGRLYYQQS